MHLSIEITVIAKLRSCFGQLRPRRRQEDGNRACAVKSGDGKNTRENPTAALANTEQN
jgi:hypothetical protein